MLKIEDLVEKQGAKSENASRDAGATENGRTFNSQIVYHKVILYKEKSSRLSNLF